jgi:RNA ligase (TIGR02306 family)
MRKMATIRKINDICPIVGADSIECAVVGGWTVVIKRGDFAVGDFAVYCEIDSWIPHGLAPFLSKGQEPREYNGVAGERLRTVKLRGQLSQGLLLPLSIWAPKGRPWTLEEEDFEEGQDVSAYLGIQKYEPPVPAQLAGEVRGLFPGFIPKTDQERIQNLTVELEEWKDEKLSWEVTEKLDGASMTVYAIDDDSGVCSRNLNLKENPDNSLWSVAIRNNLIAKIRSTGRNLALQGEIVGEGIQGNRYKIRGQEFYLFDIYDIDTGKYLTPTERRDLANTLDIRHTPVLKCNEVLEVCTVKHILKWAEGVSTWGGMEREGIVFKCNEREVSFKAISNSWLMKNE